MASLEDFIDRQLARGRAHFTKSAAMAELRQSPQALQAAIARLAKKGRLALPRSGLRIERSAHPIRPAGSIRS
jgi:hypothetical protein